MIAASSSSFGIEVYGLTVVTLRQLHQLSGHHRKAAGQPGDDAFEVYVRCFEFTRSDRSLFDFDQCTPGAYQHQSSVCRAGNVNARNAGRRTVWDTHDRQHR